MKNQDNNFKRALLKELTGFQYKEKEGDTFIEEADAENAEIFDFASPSTPIAPSVAPVAPVTEAPAVENDFTYTPAPRQAQPEIMGTTTISRGSIVNGGIQTRENITVEGVVNGDIASKGKVTVRGKVEGNIAGFDVDLSCEELTGDINCESKVTVQANTKIKGNLYATRATVIGCVEGNIIAKENIELLDNAVVFGDIKANSITVSEGAVIYGMVTIGKSKPDTSPF